MTELNTQENPSLLYGFLLRVKINWSRALAIITANSRHARCLLVVLLINDYFAFVFKAFYALLEYAIGRKRKAVRISKALEERRNRLLRAGVTRWMKVGFTTICLVLGFKSLYFFCQNSNMFPLQFQVGFYLAAERARFAQERQMEVGLAVVLYYALKQSNI